MMNDVENYIKQRKLTDPEFADEFESGYLSFKLGVILAETRRESGMSQEELARELNWDTSMVSNIESNIETIGISMLERYVHALGKELIVEIR